MNVTSHNIFLLTNSIFLVTIGSLLLSLVNETLYTLLSNSYPFNVLTSFKVYLPRGNITDELYSLLVVVTSSTLFPFSSYISNLTLESNSPSSLIFLISTLPLIFSL